MLSQSVGTSSQYVLRTARDMFNFSCSVNTSNVTSVNS